MKKTIRSKIKNNETNIIANYMKTLSLTTSIGNKEKEYIIEAIYSMKLETNFIYRSNNNCIKTFKKINNNALEQNVLLFGSSFANELLDILRRNKMTKRERKIIIGSIKKSSLFECVTDYNRLHGKCGLLKLVSGVYKDNRSFLKRMGLENRKLRREIMERLDKMLFMSKEL